MSDTSQTGGEKRHPELDDTQPCTLASARRVFMTNWDSLLLVDTRCHLKRCEVFRFEHALGDQVKAGQRVWENDVKVAQYQALLYDLIMVTDALERCRDGYCATSGIMMDRVHQLVEKPDLYESGLSHFVADCIRLNREGITHCADASGKVRQYKEEQSQLRRLWRETESPPREERHQVLYDRDMHHWGSPLDEHEAEELRTLNDAHFLVFRQNVARAYMKLKFDQPSS